MAQQQQGKHGVPFCKQQPDVKAVTGAGVFLVNIGRPHVEGHQGEFEADARAQISATPGIATTLDSDPGLIARS